jgi:hypothetical protein
MNNPLPDQGPSKIAGLPAVSPKTKIALGAAKQHNREIGHFVKAASMHRAMPARSLSHSRGR